MKYQMTEGSTEMMQYMAILIILAGCAQPLVGYNQSTYESNEEYFVD